MKSVVVYATHSGNTKKIAERIGSVLSEHGDVESFAVEDAPSRLPEADLLVIGGPTEGHGMTPEMVSFLDALPPSCVFGRKVAAFDTRLPWPRILSGSAAVGIAKAVCASGAEIIAAPESFIVTTEPALKSGELERAGPWALSLVTTVDRREQVAVA